MAWLLDLMTLVALLIGLFFMLVGAIGTLRMPDMYNRLHAATKCSTLGLMGLLVATVLQLPDVTVLSKAVLTMLFIFVSNPVGAHLLAKAGLYVRCPQWPGTLSDDWEEDRPHDGEEAAEGMETRWHESARSGGGGGGGGG